MMLPSRRTGKQTNRRFGGRSIGLRSRGLHFPLRHGGALRGLAGSSLLMKTPLSNPQQDGLGLGLELGLGTWGLGLGHGLGAWAWAWV